ncbi:right-handed parallel beta-helix repeat-containing protein [Lentisphaera profundi]|uniref:Right-handed parallel beta-helix repeat-containing protein n=1 Tax=Lentisphaera profundi TaxID=1658616 RepID=A0ABY7VT11_9BACT|nr:right-handed parallel beta-helix repeat-containing protein [Lentisphaera profundi]WDE96889.1 right-handed parallel beta-helix repeat-containing protein [Lentisphaera profundi]
MKSLFNFRSLLCLFTISLVHLEAATYYVDNQANNERANGLTEKTAFKDFTQVNRLNLLAGDKVLLKRGGHYHGAIKLQSLEGTEIAPIELASYGDENLARPKIDGQGYFAVINLDGCAYVNVSGLELTNDGGKARDKRAKHERYGVALTAIAGDSHNINLRDLKIHHIFASESRASEGYNPTSNFGMGVILENKKSQHSINRITLEDSDIRMVGFYGIRIKGSMEQKVSMVNILNNKTVDTGCSGVQMSYASHIRVKGNDFAYSGSNKDPRMHARGSGSWCWGSENITYEENKFSHARGKGDSAGIHIDFNCKNIIVQRNLSIDNEGGFIEILGNNWNCTYRYNISINDGARIKGENRAFQEGKILWFSSFCGKDGGRKGPYNNYIYNNTIFVKKGILNKFSVAPTTEGVLIANNIFHLMDESKNVSGDQFWNKKLRAQVNKPSKNIVFGNNIYNKETSLPADFEIQDKAKIIGDVEFKNAGSLDAHDYIPINSDLVIDKGIEIQRLANDPIGIIGGLKMKSDFFGNPIKGRPDMGAIEIQ